MSDMVLIVVDGSTVDGLVTERFGVRNRRTLIARTTENASWEPISFIHYADVFSIREISYDHKAPQDLSVIKATDRYFDVLAEMPRRPMGVGAHAQLRLKHIDGGCIEPGINFVVCDVRPCSSHWRISLGFA